MDYLEFLGRVHERLRPATYLEIGIRFGASLELARCPSIGVDPAYELRIDTREDTALFRETSDEFFARADPLEHFGGRPTALSFIDGMHLSEYALRDFANVERHCQWPSVVIFDDVLPRDEDEAARERTTRRWAGDVYKVAAVLARRRPDLVCLRADVEPTGVLVVLNLDPQSMVLSERYERIERNLKVPDPQKVTDDVLERRGVHTPEAVLDASFWDVLREGQAGGLPEPAGRQALKKALRSDFGRGVTRRRLRDVLASPA